jgi:cell division protease FtsH
MSSKRNDDRRNDQNNNNNFFNQNPLLVFAIFSIVIVMVFKSLTGAQDGSGGFSSSQQASQTKNVTKVLIM